MSCLAALMLMGGRDVESPRAADRIRSKVKRAGVARVPPAVPRVPARLPNDVLPRGLKHAYPLQALGFRRPIFPFFAITSSSIKRDPAA